VLDSVKCPEHQNEATGICVHCGRAVCAVCAPVAAGDRTVCSDRCAAALQRADRAMQLILQKSLQNTRASAFYYLLCGILCAGGSVGAYFWLPMPFLVWFTAGCSVLFLVTGAWYAAIARRQNPKP